MTKFHVENDNLSDDWCSFPTRAQAETFIRECCAEIASYNVDENGLGNVPAFSGMTTDQIVEVLYVQNADCIEERA